MAIRFPKENNEWWPLPPDYPRLDPAGRKAARLNALHLQETPEDVVAGWALFRRYYLGADPKDERFPDGYFYKSRMPSPPAHYEWIQAIARYRMSVLAAPRFSAKSVVVGTEYPMYRLLTNPYHKIMLVLATDGFVEQRFDEIMFQLGDNKYIREDFGDVRPARGVGVWNRHFLTFKTRAMLIGRSVEGKMRGQHPDEIILDDVEQDLITISNIDRFLSQMENLLFVVIRPMLARGSGLAWIGTLDHLRSFIYYVATSDDPRFKSWHRMIHTAMEAQTDPETGAPLLDEEGKEKFWLFWPEKWSKEDLDRELEELGPYAFASQFLNSPMSSAACVLKLDFDRHGYEFDGPDPVADPNPLRVETVLTHRVAVKSETQEWALEERKLDWIPFVRGLRRFITVDYAYTMESHSDFSAVHVMGQSAPDMLWSLDLFVGKVTDNALIEQIWKMAVAWHVNVIGIESVGLQEGLVYRMRSELQEKIREMGWSPRLLPIKYPTSMSKASRIMALEWRFNRDMIRFPTARCNEQGPYAVLRRQIEDFTPDMRSLQHDDALDTLAMHSRVIQSGAKPGPPVGPREGDIITQLRQGKLYDEVLGIPLASAIPMQHMPLDLARELMIKKHTKGRSRHIRRPDNILED